jgi:malate/lactate dehydrogenase
MHDVVIIGAGELGGAVAHVLARRDCVRSIRLIDETGRAAAGKALDIAQAGPVEGFATQLTGSADLSRAAGASLVVLADRMGGGEWQGDEGWLLLKRLSASAGAVIVCAGASQRELIERGVRELGFRRDRLFGSAPEALAGGARAMVALAAAGSPRDVALSVLGVPPHHTVIPWEDATMAGFALTRILDENTRRRLSARVTALWPPGPHALATAATMVIEAIAGRSRRIASCFVAPESAAAARRRTGALPVRFGPAGIVDVLAPALSVVEQITLDNALML